MVNKDNNTNPGEMVAPSVPPVVQEQLVSGESANPRRTAGLWLFDAFLYPFLTNFVVFGISVAATYLTNKGGLRNARGEPLHGRIGQWFHNRGNGVVNFFKKFGMSDKQADMSKMVFFSFADGTAVAPMVKLIEDRREKIAKRIDDSLGIRPENELAAYKAEPKQSWFSVIAGRLAVASIVVPTAVFMGKVKWGGKSLNDKFFNDPGKKLGGWIAKKPHIAKYFGKLDVTELGRVGVFEAFYTSVCTAGLYVTSRFLARLTGKKKTGEMKSILDDNGNDFKQETPASSAPAASEETPAKSYSRSVKPAEILTKTPAATHTQQVTDANNSSPQLAI